MSTNDPLICEVCEGPSPARRGRGPGAGERRGERQPGLLDTGADGRLAMFHEEHWPMRVGGLNRTRPRSRQGTLMP